MAPHINSVVRTCYSHIRQIAHIRPFLTRGAAATLTNTIVTSRLDYVNSLLIGLPKCSFRKLELVQNNAARMVCMKKKRDHVTPLLESLHWLPVEYRVRFKVNMLTYKALHGLTPQYLSSLLTPYTPSRNLRSSSQGLLQEKRTKCKAGERAFSVCAPKLWNALPNSVRASGSYVSFKKSLKTHYFRLAFTV